MKRERIKFRFLFTFSLRVELSFPCPHGGAGGIHCEVRKEVVQKKISKWIEK